MIYHELLMPLLEILDERASTLISWVRYLPKKHMANYT